jgi:hypothetical protein
MELLKDTENICGQMVVLIKVTLSTESDMDMEFGRTIKKFIKEIIEWIKNKDLECISGLESKFIKENSKMILERVMVNYLA